MSGLNEMDWLTGLHVSVIRKVSDTSGTEKYIKPTDHKGESKTFKSKFKTFKSNWVDFVEK